MGNLSSLFEAISGNLAGLILIAGVVERLSEFAKQTIQKYMGREMEPLHKQILTTVIAILICVFANVTVLSTGSIVPLVNSILAGLVVSLGSHFLHDLSSLLSSLKANSENKMDK